MTNIDTTENIKIKEREIEKVTNYKYLGQKMAMENRTKQKVSIRIKAYVMECFWKVQRNLPRQVPFHESKKKGL